MRGITKVEHDRIVQSDNFFLFFFFLFFVHFKSLFVCVLLCAMACGQKVIDFLPFFCVCVATSKKKQKKAKLIININFTEINFSWRLLCLQENLFCISGRDEQQKKVLFESREKLMKRFWVLEEKVLWLLRICWANDERRSSWIYPINNRCIHDENINWSIKKETERAERLQFVRVCPFVSWWSVGNFEIVYMNLIRHETSLGWVFFLEKLNKLLSFKSQDQAHWFFK